MSLCPKFFVRGLTMAFDKFNYNFIIKHKTGNFFILLSKIMRLFFPLHENPRKLFFRKISIVWRGGRASSNTLFSTYLRGPLALTYVQICYPQARNSATGAFLKILCPPRNFSIDVVVPKEINEVKHFGA